MKKIMNLILVFVLALSLIACNNRLNEKDTTQVIVDKPSNSDEEKEVEQPTLNPVVYEEITDIEKIPTEFQKVINSYVTEFRVETLIPGAKGPQYILIILGERPALKHYIHIPSVKEVDNRVEIIFEELELEDIKSVSMDTPWKVIRVESSLIIDVKKQVAYTEITEVDLLPLELQEIVNANEADARVEIARPTEGPQYLLISLGERPSLGYRLNILSVNQFEGKIYVEYEELKPEGFAATAIDHPWKVIRIESPLPIIVRNQ